MLVYKKVQVTQNGTEWFRSAFTQNLGLTLMYRLNQVITAPDPSMIFAFEDIIYARNWGMGNKVLECETSDLAIAPETLPDLNNSLEDIIKFWEQFRDGIKWTETHRCGCQSVPSGTILCRWLRPLRVVS